MPGLAEVMRALTDRDDVETVVLVSADGLPVDHAGTTGLAGRPVDADALAALAAALGQAANHLGTEAGRGTLRTAVIEFESGIVIGAGVADGNILLVLAKRDTNVGDLLYALRQHRPTLAALL